MEPEEILDQTNFTLCVVDGEPYIIDDQLMLVRKRDNQLVQVSLTSEVQHSFGLEDSASWSDGKRLEDQAPTTCLSTPKDKCGDSRGWTPTEIRYLIQLVGEHDTKFRSSTIKNDIVWREIATKLKSAGHNHTTQQCMDKWKYLKSKYTKKKDNMGDRSTGAATMKFQYFDEMESVLETNHAIVPIAVASSISGRSHEPQVSNTDDALEEPPEKVSKHQASCKKESAVNVILAAIKRTSEAREASAERQTAELVAARDRATAAYATKMDELLQILRKKN